MGLLASGFYRAILGTFSLGLGDAGSKPETLLTLNKEKLVEKGSALVKAIFKGRDGAVAGSEIIEGMFTVGNRVHAFRNGRSQGQAFSRAFEDGHIFWGHPFFLRIFYW